jgi:hypothetical protein
VIAVAVGRRERASGRSGRFAGAEPGVGTGRSGCRIGRGLLGSFTLEGDLPAACLGTRGRKRHLEDAVRVRGRDLLIVDDLGETESTVVRLLPSAIVVDVFGGDVQDAVVPR